MKGVRTRSVLWRYKYLFPFALGVVVGLPLFTYAQSVGASGLVPCGAVTSANYFNPMYYLSATSCNFCYLAKLIQNVVNFLVMVTIPISVAMFAWAGIMFFTATGNPKKIARAKGIFSSVFIGFIITIAGWLVVQIVLQTITNGGFYSANNWVNLDCSEYNQFRKRDATIDQILTPIQTSNNPGGTGTPTPTPGTPTPTPTPGGDTYADDQARTQLQLAGISVTSSGNCSDRTNASCTSLEGIQVATINQTINLKTACGCDFSITGGTETGHSAGDNSHTAGNKVDISLGSVDSYIQSTMTSIGNRAGDNAPQWRDSYGNIYAREGSHWDILIRTVGPLQSRPGS